MADSGDLQKRAACYWKFAEQAGTPWIWKARLRTTKALEAEAARAGFNPARFGDRILSLALATRQIGDGAEVTSYRSTAFAL